jgi:uncharacterized protein
MPKSAQELLQDFAQHVRRPIPASDHAGLAVYQRLFINNVRLMLAQSFPVMHALLGSNQFDQWVAIFYAAHRAQTPRFTELAPEFLSFCQTLLAENSHLAFGHPTQALIELLHYEWIETELALSNAEKQVPECLSGMLMLSPLARVLAYQYPVHQISAKQPPSNVVPTEATFLLVWRDDDFEVKFQALNAASVQLLLQYQQPNAQLPAEASALEILRRWQRIGVLISGNLV